MYVILKKVEIVKRVYGPFNTKDSATAKRRELQKKSGPTVRYVVRSVDTTLSEEPEEMDPLWEDD